MGTTFNQHHFFFWTTSGELELSLDNDEAKEMSLFLKSAFANKSE